MPSMCQMNSAAKPQNSVNICAGIGGLQCPSPQPTPRGERHSKFVHSNACAWRRSPRALEPGMYIRSVVQDQLGYDLQVAPFAFVKEFAEVFNAPVSGVHSPVI